MSLKEKYSIYEGFIPTSHLMGGSTYFAYNVEDVEEAPITVIIKEVYTDDQGDYQVGVIYEDGSHDDWYIHQRDKVFKNYVKPAEPIVEKVKINPTIKILKVVKKLNEGDTHEYHVSLKPVPRRMQIGDSVIYEKKKGFITGAHGDNWIVQCQFQTFWAKTNQLTSLETKTKVVGYDQFKFDKKTQELLFEQMVKCGIFMNNIPIKLNGCYVNYADWKKAKDDDHIQIMVENQTTLYEKSIIRIIEDVNSFANPANYIEGVIIDERTDEAIENVMINVEDYTNGLGDADPVRILRIEEESGEEMTDTIPKALLRTLSV